MPRLILILFALAACARPDHIEIDPRAPRLSRKGESQRLHARMMDRAGKVFPQERARWKSRDPMIAAVDESGTVTALGSTGIRSATARVHLTSADPAVARVDPEGRVWPVSPGDVVVRARLDDKESGIPVHVRR
jgi:hypothetical protein